MDLQKILKEYGSAFFVCFGTLLGLYRDKKLLVKDMDIDIAIYISDSTEIDIFNRYLKKKNFVFLHRYCVDGVGIIQDSFMFKGVKIDISYCRRTLEKDMIYAAYDMPDDSNKILIYCFSKVLKTREMKIDNIDITIPQNTDVFLAEVYGDNWRVPDKEYISEKKYLLGANVVLTDLHASLIKKA